MTGGDCCVFKSLWRSVDGKHLMRLQSETSVFKFLRRSVGETSEVSIHLLFVR